MVRIAFIATTLLIAACGVEQVQPAPTPDADRWGHLPPDADPPPAATPTRNRAAVPG